jgi:hypothetical protein
MKKHVNGYPWQKETAATGFPNYPQKAQWEKYRQEFGG